MIGTIGRGSGITINRKALTTTTENETNSPDITGVTSFYKYIDKNGYDKFTDTLQTVEGFLTNAGRDKSTEATLQNILNC